MKKSDVLRRRTRKLIAKNLIVLVVLAVVAFVGARSWFTKTQQATANNIDVRTQVVDGLEYFIVEPNANDQYSAINTWITNYNNTHQNEQGFVDKRWHEGELTFDFSDPELKFMEDLFLCETTSDGQTFKIPSLIQYGEIAYVDTTQASEDFEDAVPNNEYMSFDLYFRCKSQTDVVLKSASSIAPKAAIDTSTEEGMKNGAIGAVRMSIYNGNTRELLWIPAPRLWFDGTANNNEGQLHVDYTGSTAGTYKPGGNVTVSGDTISLTGDGTNEHWYYSASGSRVKATGDNIVASTGTGSSEYTLGQDMTVVTLDRNGNDGYYYNHVRINLWIEGEDAESRLKFVGGKFNMSLIFDGTNGQ